MKRLKRFIILGALLVTQAQAKTVGTLVLSGYMPSTISIEKRVSGSFDIRTNSKNPIKTYIVKESRFKNTEYFVISVN